MTYDLNLFRFFTGQSDGRSLTPQQVKGHVTSLAALHQADEIMAVTNMYCFEDRKRSFQLLKEVLSWQSFFPTTCIRLFAYAWGIGFNPKSRTLS